jgi:hypothetical protein
VISQREDEHVETGRALLTDAFKDKAVVEGILKSHLNQAHELEQEIWRLIWGWVLEWTDPDDPTNTWNAEGQQLDDLGAIVGQLREGRTDADYIVAIRIRAAVNRSQGRSADMVKIANLMSSLATYVEYFPLAWEVSLYNVANGGDLIRLLTKAKPAGSYGVLLTSNWAEANVFKFDRSGQNTKVFGSVTSGTPNVRFPAALPTNPAYRTA